MATTTQNDNRAKFLELRKQGISVADARNQTYWPAPVVADQTPAPLTPVTPAPITNQEVQMGVNAVWGTAEQRRETRSGIIAGQQITPPPTPTSVPTRTPETPVQTHPTVQVDTAPVTQTTPTQTPFQQAQAESEKIKAQNEAQMKLNTQQADLKAQERQQVAQETAKANTPVNQKDVLNALVSGVSVAPQNTQAYRNAQMQYKTYQKFATMTPTQLADNMKMGEIGTETAQLLASNPNYIKAKEDFDKFQKNQSINNMIKSVAEGAKGKTTAVDHYQNASDAIAKKLGINETNADAFARIVSQDPETLQLTKTVSNIAKQLNTLNTERNAVYEDLKKQYPDLSASAIMTLMAWRTKEATAQIDALNSSLTLTQADLKMAMEMAKAEYDATKEDITLQAGLAKEDRAMQNALDLSQAQFDQKLAQQAQLTNDPTTAIGWVIKQFSDLGIVGDRDLAWHVAEQKRLGMTLPEYTKKMIEDFKAKPEYKAKIATKPTEAPQTKEIDVNGKKVTVQWNGKEWTPVQWATIERELAKQKYGSTPAVRNFNPWNIMDTGFGWKKVEWERFTVFDTPSEGFNALVAKIKNIQAGNSKVYSPDMTLLQYIGKYAPSSDNNNPQWYASAIANNLGISINTKIWQIDPVKLAEEHARHEDGNSYKMLKDLGIIGWWKWMQNEDISMQALSLVQWLGGTADERKAFADNVIKVAQRDNISLPDAKKKLGYKSADDTEFAKARATEYKSIKSDTRDKLSNANTALTLLNSPQTAIWDVASIVWFLKTIDPASVARESEVDSVRNARGIVDSLSNQFAQLKEGTKLTDSQRTQLKDAIQTIVNAGNAKYNEYVNDTAKEFNDRWLDPTVYISSKEIEKAKSPEQRAKEAVQKILPWATGFKSFMSELTTLLQ